MIEKIHEPISVSLVFNCQTKEVYPFLIRWRGKLYRIRKVGLHHFFRDGRTLVHVFSVCSETLFFRLSLNTDTLHWTLEEIADDLPN